MYPKDGVTIVTLPVEWMKNALSTLYPLAEDADVVQAHRSAGRCSTSPTKLFPSVFAGIVPLITIMFYTS